MRPQLRPPQTLPGTFFVLEFNKFRDCFILTVDDEQQSSYKLGNDIQVVMAFFARWGIAEFGNRCIDIAKEFGSVQGIPSQDRTIPLFERNVSFKRSLVFQEETGYVGTLPSLRPTT